MLVIASDLEEEVPIWRLRLKQAADRGAYLVVANSRWTRMDDFASETVRYETGEAASALAGLEDAVAKTLREAENLIIVAGAEGLDLDGSRALMQTAANFLIDSGHVGKPNNGLLSPFPGPNGMGQYYLGFTPENAQTIIANPPQVLLIAQADVLADDPNAADWLSKAETVINLTLFEDELGDKAAITLPIQSFAEHDGSFTSGERRVQRFYTAHGPVGEARPLWQILLDIGEKLGRGRTKLTAAAVMHEMTGEIPAFADCSYKALGWTEQQYPMIGDDVWYGGTAYKNRGGLGVQIPTEADTGKTPKASKPKLPKAIKAGRGKLLVLPVVSLYNRERMFRPSDLMDVRVPAAYAVLAADDAKRLKVQPGDTIEIEVEDGPAVQVEVRVSESLPKGTLLLPRHLTTTAMPLAPAAASVSSVQVAEKVKG